ncbi:MAG: class I SAM-dependent methyltransferase [Acidiphilium sp.]|nr:class I SAM-dependent methyltransferase [Acidiphilium sp.]
MGVHKGDSYFCVVEAISRFPDTVRAVGVDTWQGDAHAGFYDESVYRGVVAVNAQYQAFSTLMRCTFDDAFSKISGQIDLLHIDGLHTYEAVSHDFRLWEPRANDVILLHDINVPKKSFGVWQLWDEIKVEFPGRTFEFSHCNGLAVLAKSDKGLAAVRLIQVEFGSPVDC